MQTWSFEVGGSAFSYIKNILNTRSNYLSLTKMILLRHRNILNDPLRSYNNFTTERSKMDRSVKDIAHGNVITE